MKSVLLLIIFTVISFKSQSPVFTLGQSPVNLPMNSYIKDTNNILNKFVGTWLYNQNGKMFTMSINKQEMIDFNEYYKDMLFGNFKYQINNSLIANTFGKTGFKSGITGATLWEGNPNKVTLFFDDPERPKMSARVTLTYSNINGIEKLHWDLKLTGYVSSRDPNMNPATDFRVPTNVELIKQ
jgi:hypothetical protein